MLANLEQPRNMLFGKELKYKLNDLDSVISLVQIELYGRKPYTSGKNEQMITFKFLSRTVKQDYANKSDNELCLCTSNQPLFVRLVCLG